MSGVKFTDIFNSDTLQYFDFVEKTKLDSRGCSLSLP